MGAKVKEKRKTHVRGLADLNLNAQLQRGVEDNEERIAEMVQKEEERGLERITESGENMHGEHASGAQPAKPKGKNLDENGNDGGETEPTTTEGDGNEMEPTTVEGDGNEAEPINTEDDGNAMEPTNTEGGGNDAVELDILEGSMPDIQTPEINIPTGSIPTINWDGLKNIAPTIKIIFGWGQILSSFNLTFKIQWPQAFDDLMSAMYMPFNVDIFAAFKDFGCSVPSDYITSFYMHMAMLPILLTVIFSAWVTAKIYKKIMCCKLCI